MGPQDLNEAAPAQVGTGADGQPIYEGNLNDVSSQPNDGSADGPTDEGDASPETDTSPAPAPNAADDASGATQVDTGDATFVGAASDPDPDVIPIAGDSSSAQDQIYADPGLGDRGEPPPPEPPTPDPTDPANVTFAPLASTRRPDADGVTDTAADVVRPDQGAGTARPWILPAGVIAAALVMGAVAFGATRGGGDRPQPAPVATIAAPAAPANATVTVTARPSIATVVPIAVPHAEIDLQLAPIPGAGGVGPFGPKCPHPWKIVVSLTVTNAQPGDPVHLVLEGPDIPSDVTGTLDGSLSYTTPTWTTTTGTGRWTARVDTVGGRAASSGGNVLNLETCN